MKKEYYECEKITKDNYKKYPYYPSSVHKALDSYILAELYARELYIKDMMKGTKGYLKLSFTMDLKAVQLEINERLIYKSKLSKD
jgi:hypothetical protein